MVFLRSKVIVIGDSEVGKSSICQMLGSDGNDFPKNYNYTVVSDLNIKQITLSDVGDTVELFLNDCSGKQMYFENTKDTWLNADMFCIVIDVTNAETLKHSSYWHEKIKEMFDQKKMIGVLIGNKVDLENRRQVTHAMGKQVADKYGLKYYECSAKENNGLLEAFKHLANEYNKRYKERIQAIKNMI